MQTIAIVAPSPAPFQLGGAEKSFIALHKALSELPGTWAELIKLPCHERTFPGLLDAYENFSKLNLSHFDRIISCKYPAWIVPHHCHLVYMYHKLRGLYDHYPYPVNADFLGSLPHSLEDLRNLLGKSEPTRDDLEDLFTLCHRALKQKSLPSALFALIGPLSRSVVHFLDNIALAPGQIKKYFAISATVAARYGYFPTDAAVEILHMPSPREDLHEGENAYFFTASRLNKIKRVDILISAMSYVKADIPFKIAGSGTELESLKLAASFDRRIEFLGHVSDSRMADLYANALAVPFVPCAEDYGLIAVEALQSGKPVITTNDAGGVTELVRHKYNGLITEPNPQALGQAMACLATNKQLARELGANARMSVAHLHWGKLANIFTAALGPPVVVAAPFGANAQGNGGSRRLWHLCDQLSRYFPVRLVAMGTTKQQGAIDTTPNVHWQEHLLSWSQEAIASSIAFVKEHGYSGDDLILAQTAIKNKELLASLREAGKDAACVICVHPWLYDAVTIALPHLPVMYDAQDVEADIKATMLPPELVAIMTHQESRLCHNALHIFACSEADLRRLQELYDVPPDRLSVLPNGCDVPVIQEDRDILRQRLPYGQTRLALFFGSDHNPNMEAVFALAKIAARVPEVHFLVAGSVCGNPRIVTADFPPNMHLLGPVSERVKNMLLTRADIALNPMTTGSGTNLKSIEYLTYGLPVISTPCGMRGLGTKLMEMVEICEVEEFPATIEQVLANMPSRDQLMATASEVCNAFSWDSVFSPLCPTLCTRLSHAAHN